MDDMHELGCSNGQSKNGIHLGLVHQTDNGLVLGT